MGLVVMQSALVRSDVGHVIIGEFAMIFFRPAILFSFAMATLSAFAVVAVMACSHAVFASGLSPVQREPGISGNCGIR